MNQYLCENYYITSSGNFRTQALTAFCIRWTTPSRM